MNNIPVQYIVIGIVALVILYKKGYLKLPGSNGGATTSEEYGRKFIATLTAEAQEEVADMIARKMKDDVKAKLQAPFNVSDEPAPKPSERPV
jgi:hypothetical protein